MNSYIIYHEQSKNITEVMTASFDEVSDVIATHYQDHVCVCENDLTTIRFRSMLKNFWHPKMRYESNVYEDQKIAYAIEYMGIMYTYRKFFSKDEEGYMLNFMDNVVVIGKGDFIILHNKMIDEFCN